MSCRILLADDHEVVRSGLRTVLRLESDVTICGESADGMDAIRQANQLRPDIIIADPWLPGANGIVLTRRILESHPEQKILIFGTFDSDATVRDLLRVGVKGVVLKADPVADILGAINALRRDRTYFTSSIESVILHEYLQPVVPPASDEWLDTSLTVREQEVTQLLAEGRVTKEIGTMLGISFRTAATHRSNLMRKLGVHNIAEVTLYAASHHLIEVPIFNTLARVIEIRKRAGQSSAAKAAA
jgi:DNA-binding NarL/FixJ family response regulator